MAREITKEISDLTYDIDGYSLDEVIKKLQKIKTLLPKSHPDLVRFKISVESEQEYYGDGSYPRVKLYGYRDETKEEEDNRAAAQKEAQERHRKQIRDEAFRLGLIKDATEL